MERTIISYYYEINPGTTVFGQQHEYLAHFDVHPGRSNGIDWRLHDEALKHSRRVWLENANGVTLVKAPNADICWGQVDIQEFVWIKLKCKDIETL